jgi:hypothetical protein
MADYVGDNGINYFYGTAYSDVVYARGGNDKIFGGASSDGLYGEAGKDCINGGRGADTIVGGRGADMLLGGTGGVGYAQDNFVFYSSLDSPAKNGKADIIRDWNCREDNMWMSGGHADRTLYGEAPTRAGSIEAARYQAEHSWLRQEDFAFLYNSKKDRGFFLVDNDHNGSFEFGVILLGAGSARDMSILDF